MLPERSKRNASEIGTLAAAAVDVAQAAETPPPVPPPPFPLPAPAPGSPPSEGPEPEPSSPEVSSPDVAPFFACGPVSWKPDVGCADPHAATIAANPAPTRKRPLFATMPPP